MVVACAANGGAAHGESDATTSGEPASAARLYRARSIGTPPGIASRHDVASPHIAPLSVPANARRDDFDAPTSAESQLRRSNRSTRWGMFGGTFSPQLS
jgi:hypothetical protein